MTPQDAEPDRTLTWEEVERHLFRMHDALKAFEEDGGLAEVAGRRGWSASRRGRLISSLDELRGKLADQRDQLERRHRRGRRRR